MPSTSAIAPALGVLGLTIAVGNGSSPETFTTIANISDMDLPTIGKVIEVTNVGDTWVRRFPTLLDMGKITMKLFYIPEEPTHRNSATGLRYMMLNRILKNFQVAYPDGGPSTDAFPAYVTGFHIVGKVGGAFEATIELSNSGAPSLV